MWVILIILLVVLAVCIGECIRELSDFQITYYNFSSSKVSRDMTLLFFSDLHSREYDEGNCRLLECTKKEAPDIILLGGDMITRQERRIHLETVNFIRELSKISPVYYALGNHEQKMLEEPQRYGDLFDKYMQLFEGYDVKILLNQTEKINDSNMMVTGLNIPLKAYAQRKKYQRYSLEDMNKVIGCRDDEKYQVLLAHNPTYADVYKKWGADLILSGHFHGGVVRIPGVGGIITPQLQLFPKHSGGTYREENCDIVVSRGLGDHAVKVRLFNVPELVVIHLVKTEKTEYNIKVDE